MGRLDAHAETHVRYGMMMNAARSPGVFTVLLIQTAGGCAVNVGNVETAAGSRIDPFGLWADLCTNGG